MNGGNKGVSPDTMVRRFARSILFLLRTHRALSTEWTHVEIISSVFLKCKIEDISSFTRAPGVMLGPPVF